MPDRVFHSAGLFGLISISARIDPRDPIAVAIEDPLLTGSTVIAIRGFAIPIRVAETVAVAISVPFVIGIIAAVIRTRRQTETDTGRSPAPTGPAPAAAPSGSAPTA